MKASMLSSATIKKLALLACTTATWSVQAQTSTAGYELIDLGNLNGAYTSITANGLNASGQVVGTGTRADGTTEAFITGAWGQSMVSLGQVSGSVRTIGAGINDQGQVVGTAYDKLLDSPETSRQAFVYDSQSGIRTLGLGGVSSAHAINNQGQIAGIASTRVAGGFTAGRLFVVNADGSVNDNIGQPGVYNIAGITESGLVAGNYSQSSFRESKGFVTHVDGSGWTEQTNSLTNYIDSVNNLGQLATYTFEIVQHGAQGQYSSQVLIYAQTAINDQGLVGGYAGNGLSGNPYTNVFLKDAAGNIILSGWDFGTEMADGRPAWSYTGIPDINNGGDFILNASNGHAYLARAVPEPATIGLMLLGLAGIGAATTRRRQQVEPKGLARI